MKLPSWLLGFIGVLLVVFGACECGVADLSFGHCSQDPEGELCARGKRTVYLGLASGGAAILVLATTLVLFVRGRRRDA